MPHDPNLLGIYKLPAPLLLAGDCLGHRIPLKIGKFTGEIVLPSADRSSQRIITLSPQCGEQFIDHLSVEPPQMFGDARERIEAEQCERGLYRSPGTRWTQSEHWGVDRSSSDKPGASVCVCLIAVEVTVPQELLIYRSRIEDLPGEPAGKPLYELFTEIDPWFDRVRTWIEVVTDQDADPYQPLQMSEIPGDGLTLVTREGHALSLTRRSWLFRVDHTNLKQEAITLSLLHDAIKQSNDGVRPSDVHLLLRDSRTAFRRGYHRRAVIEAGSAVEIVLANLNNQLTHVDPGGRPPTLGWYVRQANIAAVASLPGNTVPDLVNVRNCAIHENLEPTREAAERALTLARQIVDSLEPLPI